MEDIEDFFEQAWEAKKQWAKTLILTDDTSVEKAFKACAEKNRLLTKNIPLAELKHVVGGVLKSFADL
jgi:hypothetical protein